MHGRQTVGIARVEMSEIVLHQAEELRLSALAMVRAGEIEDALAVYDAAMSHADEDETRELITINKADALVALERSGPEVQALPSILMRRRTPRHTFLAAYALLFKYRTAGEIKRAMFYAHIAYDVAVEAEQVLWKIGALNELGMAYEFDSKFEKAIEYFEEALSEIERISDANDQSFSRVAILQNLGYNKLLVGETVEGLRMIHSVFDQIESPNSKCESLIDLCYGYLDLEDYPQARVYGEAGLELASEPRQVRNAHYLLGEAAYKMDDTEAAEHHFEQLARYYPQFRNLKTLLFAIDLRSMLNLKL
jgi:tetratricopeptide (TPR) repeat protein